MGLPSRATDPLIKLQYRTWESSIRVFAQGVQETPKAISAIAVALGASQKTLLLKKPQTFDTGFRGSKLNKTESPPWGLAFAGLKRAVRCQGGKESHSPTQLWCLWITTISTARAVAGYCYLDRNQELFNWAWGLLKFGKSGLASNLTNHPWLGRSQRSHRFQKRTYYGRFPKPV